MPRAASNLLVAPAPTKPSPTLSIWQRAFRILKSIAARIDLSNFPPSCCG
jgi:hypothetical protein